jgi:hypothetical protein
MKEDEIIFSMNRHDRNAYKFWLENMKGKDHVDNSRILKGSYRNCVR